MLGYMRRREGWAVMDEGRREGVVGRENDVPGAPALRRRDGCALLGREGGRQAYNRPR